MIIEVNSCRLNPYFIYGYDYYFILKNVYVPRSAITCRSRDRCYDLCGL